MSKIKCNKLENTATTDGGLSIDSSGRVLVATTSNSSASSAQFSNLQVSGNSSDGTGGGSFSVNLGNSGNSLTNNGFVGGLYYASTSGEFAAIEARADGNCGSGDYPGRLIFSTTADGASSPTERMRIDSSGNINVGGAVTAENTAKMWINFNGTGTISIRDSFNVASITDNGTGDYTFTFTNAMPNANYCVVESSGTTAGIGLYVQDARTDELTVYSVNYAGGNEDNEQSNVAIFGD